MLKEDPYSHLIHQFHQLNSLKFEKEFLPKPHFVGVGAGRCGTTSIYTNLSQHPDVYMSPIKEVNYFGITDKESRNTGLTFSEYRSYFLGAEEGQVIGEISPAYLTYKLSLERLKSYMPEIKIIVTVRDPLERFVSQFKHHASKHQILDVNDYSEQALADYKRGVINGKQWFKPVKCLYQSKYKEGLQYLYKNFPEENILIVDFVDFKDRNKETLRKIQAFLGVEYRDLTVVRANRSSESQVKNAKLTEENKTALLEAFKEDIVYLRRVHNIKY